MDLGLKDRVALVGGSSKGLGFAAAVELAREGAHVVVNSRSRAAVDAACESIRAETGVDAFGIEADLSTSAGVAALVDAVHERFGRVDVLVTNTGGPPGGSFEAHSEEVWRDAFAQNFESVLNLCRAVLPGMKERKWGRIINITSISVKQPVAGLILSNAIRAGVTGFARTLANEVAAEGITVNNVLPGYTATERLNELANKLSEMNDSSPEAERARWSAEIPMNRLGQPDELAALITFLASERAGYITAQSIAVDGGWIKSLV
jgi:3-oxoacyl-[acyl-carrier protein] reductase